MSGDIRAWLSKPNKLKSIARQFANAQPVVLSELRSVTPNDERDWINGGDDVFRDLNQAARVQLLSRITDNVFQGALEMPMRQWAD